MMTEFDDRVGHREADCHAAGAEQHCQRRCGQVRGRTALVQADKVLDELAIAP